MDKQHAHQLLDQLDAGQLAAIIHLLEVMTVQGAMMPNDVPDDESFTEAERRAVSEADEWLKDNEPIPHDKVLAELGLTMADWEKMADEAMPEQTPHRNG